MATSKQIAANRRNARKSTGPKTQTGKAVAKMNSLKHGLRAEDVVATGWYFQEDPAAYNQLRRKLWESLAPVGVLEEILVDRMTVCTWCRRRALKAEQGEIQLSTNVNTRADMIRRAALEELFAADGLIGPQLSAAWVERSLKMFDRLRQRVEADGELTEAALQEAITTVARPNLPVLRELARLRTQLSNKPDNVAATDWKTQHCQQVLRCLDKLRRQFALERELLAADATEETQARLAAGALPSADKLEKILRYLATQDHQFYRAWHQLERLQRMRQGELVPAPLTMEVSTNEESHEK